MTPDCTISVLHDVLRVYDHRFLDLDRAHRDRLMDGTRRFLGESGLSDDVRSALPASYRLRAFCIQRGLRDELERLIRDEVAGSPGGAVVVGGRVYAMYPYLRGVPRQDADITAEVGVEHRLEALAWKDGRVRVTGHAAVERVETPRTHVEVLLRERAARSEHRVAAEPSGGGFRVFLDPSVLAPGRWDVHVAATAHGVTRQARFGRVREPGLRLDDSFRHVPGRDTEAGLYLTRGGHLALLVREARGPAPLRSKIIRRFTR
ncbi:hypothetical protein [Actinomadura harenae]|uniref:Uncharacterized protein n=1 Tax=Actinomadura harenae TaxID=2483351 RepID=A0A3M2MAY9_9ACTN|nr:hypothetical protein [Actinomadura harenae]RMI46787.1 hypothetical protein EBO15_05440 [Actinomadura harenae]